jgi:hypothetical protein
VGVGVSVESIFGGDLRGLGLIWVDLWACLLGVDLSASVDFGERVESVALRWIRDGASVDLCRLLSILVKVRSISVDDSGPISVDQVWHGELRGFAWMGLL